MLHNPNEMGRLANARPKGGPRPPICQSNRQLLKKRTLDGAPDGDGVLTTADLFHDSLDEGPRDAGSSLPVR
jgi:hypothetical protein